MSCRLPFFTCLVPGTRITKMISSVQSDILLYNFCFYYIFVSQKVEFESYHLYMIFFGVLCNTIYFNKCYTITFPIKVYCFDFISIKFGLKIKGLRILLFVNKSHVEFLHHRLNRVSKRM